MGDGGADGGGSGARLRADARRNRAQILAAARELFVTRGFGVPMEEVARTAGVGVGTLYRRFPDRDALIHAVAVDTVHMMTAVARDAQAEEPDAWSALERYVRACAEVRIGVLQTDLDPRIHASVRADPELRTARKVWLGLLERMVRDAQADGTLRGDVSTGDVLQLLRVLTREPPEEQGGTPAGRMVAILLDGLRAAGATALPGVPVTLEPLSRGRRG